MELGSSEYGIVSYLDNTPAVALAIFQAPGSNALQLATDVKSTMEELKRNFPQGVDYRVVYDPTQFVSESIDAVITRWSRRCCSWCWWWCCSCRAGALRSFRWPRCRCPIVGTFAVLLMLGFSINTLSLFGLVLSIGIVVDDAIVVVENVERNIAAGLSPRDATYKAMDEVSGPIIAIALVLTAVFVPIAFLGGLTGEFYRQFAVTIAISTLISAFNSLTLSPALAAAVLRPHSDKPDWATRVIDKGAGWIFRPFNRFFARASDSYGRGVARLLRMTAVALVVYLALLAFGVFGFLRVPQGFVPSQDKDYVIAFAQLPDAASLDRTRKVIRSMTETMLKEPGVEGVVNFEGMSITNGFGSQSNAGVAFAVLDQQKNRKGKDMTADAIGQRLQQKFFGIEEAFIGVVPPPPCPAWATWAASRCSSRIAARWDTRG